MFKNRLKKIITKNTALIITTIVVASTILIPFTSTKATEEAKQRNYKRTIKIMMK